MSDASVVTRPIIGASRYAVSQDGLVLDLAKSREVGQFLSRDGYRKVNIRLDSGERKAKFVHRLVAENWLDGSGEQVRHIDGDKLNNSVSNLAWGTCRENIMDKWRHGRMPHGPAHHGSKLTPEAVLEIRASKESNAELGARFGVTRSAIYHARNGDSYGWL